MQDAIRIHMRVPFPNAIPPTLPGLDRKVISPDQVSLVTNFGI